MSDYPIILGINYGGHDTSACLTIGGNLIAACEEERFSKEKHSRDFPVNSVNECLSIAKLTIDQIDEIGFIFDPIYGIRENYLKSALEDEKRIEFLFNDIQRIKDEYNIEQTIRKKSTKK